MDKQPPENIEHVPQMGDASSNGDLVKGPGLNSYELTIIKLDNLVAPEDAGPRSSIRGRSAWLKFFLQRRRWILGSVMLCLYLAYFTAAVMLDYNRAKDLVIVTCIALVVTICAIILKLICLIPWGMRLRSWLTEYSNDHPKVIKSFLIACSLVLLSLFVGLVMKKAKSNFISLAGFLCIILGCFIFSKNSRKVVWRPVITGFMLQLLLGVFVLRTKPGFEAFNWLGKKISLFLNYSNYGSTFVFKDMSVFAFSILPVIIFFGAIVSTLYYLGAMQAVIRVIAGVMQAVMNTTASESTNAAGNIFLGQTESPLLIRPFLKDVTMSELHAIMTCGFATISGSLMAAIASLGVKPEYLLSASVMAAPGGLAVSKLLYPETEESKTATSKDLHMDEGEERNILHAFAQGASSSIVVVASIGANLIAFISLLTMVNDLLSWLGAMVGYSHLSFEFICSYVFRPLAFMLGVDWEDSGIVAELIGKKLMINELVAYQQLMKTQSSSLPISVRSELIASYVLCGFANFSSIGIQIGGIGSVAPSRRGDLATLGIRSLIAGTLTSFLTACVAGMLI